MMFFEDITIGDRQELGKFVFDAASIKRFAMAYDPQEFHVDEAAGADSHFGGMCASGWHTTAIWTQLWANHRNALIHRAQAAGARVPRYGPSPGFDKLRWLRPVFAGDTITFSYEVTDLRPLRSKPDWGLMSIRNVGTRDDGTPVISLLVHIMVERRKPGEAE